MPEQQDEGQPEQTGSGCNWLILVSLCLTLLAGLGSQAALRMSMQARQNAQQIQQQNYQLQMEQLRRQQEQLRRAYPPYR